MFYESVESAAAADLNGKLNDFSPQSPKGRHPRTHNRHARVKSKK